MSVYTEIAAQPTLTINNTNGPHLEVTTTIPATFTNPQPSTVQPQLVANPTYIKHDQEKPERLYTLPTDSVDRKNVPLLSGCFKYFPAALAGVAIISKTGNDKHNPGQPLHHARSKSIDHGDCIIRHLMDVEDLLAAKDRGDISVSLEMILSEASQLAWRALAYSQVLHEQYGAPLAPGAKK